MDKIRKKQLISIVLLFVIVFALGNLIYNIEYLDTGDEKLYEVNNGPATGNSNIAVSSSLANNLRYVMIGFLGFGFAVAVGGLLYGAKNKDKELFKSVIFLVIGGLIFIAIIFLVLDYSDPANSMDYNPILSQTPDPSIGGGGSGGGTATADVEGRNIVLSIATLAIIVAFLALLIFGIGDILKLRSDKTLKPGEEITTGEVQQTIRRAMADLETATDVRSTILRCYRDMTRLAHRHGVREEEHLTPREFRDRMEAKLPISEGHLDGLILLFEEARYSDHALPEELKNRAKVLLGEISDDLADREEMLSVSLPASGAEGPKNVDAVGAKNMDDGGTENTVVGVANTEVKDGSQ